MTRGTALRLLAVAGLGVATFFGSAALADWVSDDPEVAARFVDDPLEAPEIVDEPPGPEEEGEDAAAPRLGAFHPVPAADGSPILLAAGVPSGDQGDEGDDGEGGDDPDGPVTIEGWAPPEDGAEDEDEGEGEGEGDDPSLFDFGFPRIGDLFRYLFVDPCAGDEPGAGGGDECPEEAVGGTVLAIHDLPPYWLAAVWYEHSDWLRAECEPPVLDGASIGLVAHASHPSEITVTLEREEDGVRRSATTSLTDPASRRHAAWAEALERDGTAPLVKHCLVISDWPGSGTYTFTIEGQSFNGETDRRTFRAFVGGPFPRAAAERERPPVAIVPFTEAAIGPGDREGAFLLEAHGPGSGVSVTVPFKGEGSDPQAVRMAVLPADGGPVSCTDVSSADIRSSHEDYEIFRHEAREIPEETRRDPDYPYDPTFTHEARASVLLKEGTTYRFCFWWQRSARRSFDPAIVDDRETRLLTMPDRMRVRVTLREVAIHRSEASPHEFTLGTTGPWLCATSFPRRALERGEAEHRTEPTCDTEGWAIPDETPFVVRGRGEDHRFVLPTPGYRTAARSVLATVPIPESEEECERRREGGGFGRGVAYACGAIGTLTIEVEYYDGRAPGNADLAVGEPETFALPDAPDPPPYPQVDWRSFRFEPVIPFEHPLEPRMELVMLFDRPVTGRVELYGEVCRTGDSPAVAELTEPGDVVNFAFEGLCRGAWYQIAIDVTDADGNRLLLHRDVGWHGALTRIDPVEVAYRASVLGDATTPSGRACFNEAREVTIGVQEWTASRSVVDGEDDLTPVAMQPRDARIRTQWDDPVPVTVTFRGSEECRGGGERVDLTGTAHVRLADLRAGLQTVRFDGAGASIVVNLEATIRG